ncbi:MAG: hypothetical protein VXZ57_05350 [Bacteroidota bacterium]|nr:hypothetical protein [Bacteroidota bacterium]
MTHSQINQNLLTLTPQVDGQQTMLPHGKLIIKSSKMALVGADYL